MPSNDLVLNVRQIAGYTATAPQPGDAVLVQRGGIGGPYLQMTVEDLVATALAYDEGPPMGVGFAPPADSANSFIYTGSIATPFDGLWMWNSYIDNTGTTGRFIGNGPWGVFRMDPVIGWQFYGGPAGAAGAPLTPTTVQLEISPTGYLTVGEQALLARDPAAPMEAATAQWVEAVVAGLQASTVWTVNGRRGDVVLTLCDVPGAAPIFSPRFSGEPRAETPPPWSHGSRLATTGWVWRNFIENINHVLNDHPFVFSFNGRTGDVTLTAEDIGQVEGLFDSPAFTGTPTAPTPAPGTNTTQIATAQFVNSAVASALSGLIATYAPIANPQFQGIPTAPTAVPGTSTGQLATTAFVMNAVTEATAGVASFNARTGAVTLEATDIQGAGGALTVSPAFTGVPTAPTAAIGTNSAQLATCAFVLNELGGASVGVMSFNGRTGAITLNTTDLVNAGGATLASPIFTGAPQGPTAASGDSSDQLATTAFVMSALATSQGVTSFNGRQGVVTLTYNDISAAGGAPLVAPAFSGNATAPTPAANDNSTRIATTAYVATALASVSGVSSFNGRTGAVTLQAADLGASVGGPFLPIAGGTLTGPIVLPAGTAAPWNAINGAVGSTRLLAGQTAGVMRWGLLLGDAGAESGSNAGSDFGLYRYSDAGASLGPALTIARATGSATFQGSVTTPVLSANSAVYFSYTNAPTFFANSSGTINAINFAGSGVYALQYNTATGQLQWIGNSAAVMVLDFSGNMTLAGSQTLGGTISAAGGNLGNVTLGAGNVNIPGQCAAGSFVGSAGVIADVTFASGAVTTGSGGVGALTAGGVTLQSNNVYGNAGTMFAVGFVQVSDPSLKEFIADDPAPALPKVQAIPVHRFSYTRQAPRSRRGFNAAEVKAVFPEGVDTASNDGTLGVGFTDLLALLWQAVQELSAEVATLKARPA